MWIYKTKDGKWVGLFSSKEDGEKSAKRWLDEIVDWYEISSYEKISKEVQSKS